MQTGGHRRTEAVRCIGTDRWTGFTSHRHQVTSTPTAGQTPWRVYGVRRFHGCQVSRFCNKDVRSCITDRPIMSRNYLATSAEGIRVLTKPNDCTVVHKIRLETKCPCFWTTASSAKTAPYLAMVIKLAQCTVVDASNFQAGCSM